jgi:hypothetical protein
LLGQDRPEGGVDIDPHVLFRLGRDADPVDDLADRIGLGDQIIGATTAHVADADGRGQGLSTGSGLGRQATSGTDSCAAINIA